MDQSLAEILPFFNAAYRNSPTLEERIGLLKLFLEGIARYNLTLQAANAELDEATLKSINSDYALFKGQAEGAHRLVQTIDALVEKLSKNIRAVAETTEVAAEKSPATTNHQRPLPDPGQNTGVRALTTLPGSQPGPAQAYSAAERMQGVMQPQPDGAELPPIPNRRLTVPEAKSLLEQYLNRRFTDQTMYALEKRVLGSQGFGPARTISADSLERTIEACRGYDFLDPRLLAKDLNLTQPEKVVQILDQLTAEDNLVRALGRKVKRGVFEEQGQEFYIVAQGRHQELVQTLANRLSETPAEQGAYSAWQVDQKLRYIINIFPHSTGAQNIKSNFLGGEQQAYAADVVNKFFAQVSGFGFMDFRVMGDLAGVPDLRSLFPLLDSEARQPDNLVLRLDGSIGFTLYLRKKDTTYEALAERLKAHKEALNQGEKVPVLQQASTTSANGNT